MKLSTILWLPALLGETLASKAPRFRANQAGHASLIPRQDAVPTFTFDELFQLQKKFLDNFISPENAIQVMRSALILRTARVPFSLTTLCRRNLSIPLSSPTTYRVELTSHAHSKGRSSIQSTFSGSLPTSLPKPIVSHSSVYPRLTKSHTLRQART